MAVGLTMQTLAVLTLMGSVLALGQVLCAVSLDLGVNYYST